LFDPEDTGTTLLQKISNYLTKTRHNNIPEDFTRSNGKLLPVMTYIFPEASDLVKFTD